MSCYYNLRINAQLWDEFTEFCKCRDMSISKAFDMFIGQIINGDELPFNVYEGVPVDGVSEVAQDTKAVAIYCKSKEVREQFKAACEDYGYTHSEICRAFVRKCVRDGVFPYAPKKKRSQNARLMEKYMKDVVAKIPDAGSATKDD